MLQWRNYALTCCLYSKCFLCSLMHLPVRLSLPPRAELDQMGLSQTNISANRLSSPAGRRVPQTNHQASCNRALGIPSLSLTQLHISVLLQPVSCWLLLLHSVCTQEWLVETQFSSILDNAAGKRSGKKPPKSRQTNKNKNLIENKLEVLWCVVIALTPTLEINCHIWRQRICVHLACFPGWPGFHLWITWATLSKHNSSSGKGSQEQACISYRSYVDS